MRATLHFRHSLSRSRVFDTCALSFPQCKMAMRMGAGAPGLGGLLKDGHKHYSGLEEVNIKNIEACKQLSQITRTSLGPNGALFLPAPRCCAAAAGCFAQLVGCSSCCGCERWREPHGAPAFSRQTCARAFECCVAWLVTRFPRCSPRAGAGMNKLVINHLGKLFITSDSATLLKELEVEHPAAKMLVMAAEMQAQECGDASNFVVTFAGELLANAEALLHLVRGACTASPRVQTCTCTLRRDGWWAVPPVRRACTRPRSSWVTARPLPRRLSCWKVRPLCSRAAVPGCEVEFSLRLRAFSPVRAPLSTAASVCHTVTDARSEEQLAGALKAVVSAKHYGYEDMISSLVARACISIMPPAPKRASVNVDSVRVCKLIGGSVTDSSVIKGLVVQRQSEVRGGLNFLWVCASVCPPFPGAVRIAWMLWWSCGRHGLFRDCVCGCVCV